MGLLGAPRRVAWALWQRRYVHASPDEITALQRRKLRRLARYAAERAPFYREKYSGIDLDRCEVTDLPVVRKDDLTARFDETVTDPRVRRDDVERFLQDPANAGRRYLGRYVVSLTSGSQGPPLPILMDMKVIERVFAYQFTRGNPSFGQTGPAEIVRRVREPARIAIVVHKREFIPSATAWHHQPGLSKLYAQARWFTAGDPDLAEQLSEFRPRVLTAYPSVLEVLALQTDRLRLAPGLKHIVAMSESLTAPARRRVVEAFGVPVTDTYGTGECLFLTNGCPAGPGMHVNADSAILEVVDDEDRPVPPGTAGSRVLLTNLVNRVQPFLRYEIGDRVVMADRPCGCGSRLPRIERVEGRTADFFWVRSGDGYRPLFANPLKNAFEEAGGVREWQAVQKERNRILLRVEPLPGTSLDRGAVLGRVEERLRAAGIGGEVEVELEFAPHLSPDAFTGKHRRIVSKVGPPTDLGLKGPGVGAAQEPAVASAIP